MKKMMYLAFLLVISQCAVSPSPGDIVGANYGSYPENYQEIVKARMNIELLDPYTAKYHDWKGPSPGWIREPFSQPVYGWRVCVDVNAKNRMGGYVGRQQHFFLIYNDVIIQQFSHRSSFCDF